jgi:hypothetical protein
MGGAWLIVICGLEVIDWSWWASEVGLGGVLQWSGVPWWSPATGDGGLTHSLPPRVNVVNHSGYRWLAVEACWFGRGERQR